MKTVGFALLAAGKGTRLKIDIPKALCPALGLTLIDHVIRAIKSFTGQTKISQELSVIVGHKKEEIIDYLNTQKYGVHYLVQREQRGTGDALRSYFSERPENKLTDYTFVVCADTPLIQSETFLKLWIKLESEPHLNAIAATFKLSEPKGYGRILRASSGFRIVEEKDATDAEKLIGEVNSGFYLVKTSYLLEQLEGLDNKNKSGEFYLTDIFKTNSAVEALEFNDPQEFLGVNTLEQLDEVTNILRKRKNSTLMNSGVVMYNADSIWVDQEVIVDPGVHLHPFCALYGKTTIERGAVIENGSVIKNSLVKAQAQIHSHSVVEDSVIGPKAQIGPFARIRPASDVGEEAKVGNFVELKKSKLHKGVKVSHLSYVGDAEIGEESNIGCGFITCNYDGRDKHKTLIGKGVFVGSDVQVVAPIKIGDKSFIAAGSTITKDVPAEGFAIARGSQTTKDGMAHRFLKTKK
jgi:bifunctional UDP-N-acetylglucosamine pyrophosphorylase/glucosamine-1-phosphate N-acetyltransferase